jgi:hypothetical protein
MKYEFWVKEGRESTVQLEPVGSLKQELGKNGKLGSQGEVARTDDVPWRWFGVLDVPDSLVPTLRGMGFIEWECSIHPGRLAGFAQDDRYYCDECRKKFAKGMSGSRSRRNTPRGKGDV